MHTKETPSAVLRTKNDPPLGEGAFFPPQISGGASPKGGGTQPPCTPPRPPMQRTVVATPPRRTHFFLAGTTTCVQSVPRPSFRRRGQKDLPKGGPKTRAPTKNPNIGNSRSLENPSSPSGEKKRWVTFVIPATQTPPFGNPGAFWLDNPPVLRPKKKGSSKREGPPWEFSTRKEKAPTPG